MAMSLVTSFVIILMIPALQTVSGQSDVIECFDCNSGIEEPNVNCRADGWVNSARTDRTNCTGKCVTRTNTALDYDATIVFRGCSLIYSIPSPEDLPEDGCYTYRGDTYCICSMNHCNIGPMGKHNGVHLDSHMQKKNKDNAWKPRPGQRPEGPIICHVCASYAPSSGNNINCPGNGNVNAATSYKVNCTGRCFAKTISDGENENNEKVVYRGCTDTQYQKRMPDPFPLDGCYQYFNIDTWCICNHDLCNSGPLGKHNGVELDDHLYTRGNKASFLEPIFTLVFLIVIAFYTCQLWYD